MSIGIGSTWDEYYEYELEDKAYLLSLSAKERKKVLKQRKIANDKYNAFFKKVRKTTKYTVGIWTPTGPVKN